MWLFLIFVLVPIIEIALFIQLGGFLGLWPTLAIVILTALLGSYFLRVQGIQTLSRLQSSVNSIDQGESAPQLLAHGALLLVAGVLLVTPGFFTDTVGLALMIPFVRDAIIRHFADLIVTQAHMVHTVRTRPSTNRSETIEGTFERLDE